MLKKSWIPVTKTEAITFSLCANSDCSKLDAKHGHVEVLTSANGCIPIPFCCYSQVGVMLVVTNLKLAESGWKGMLDLPEVKGLSVALTEAEEPLLDSSSEMEKLVKSWRVRIASRKE